MKSLPYLLAFLTVTVLFTIQSCENPLRDVNVVVNTEAVQYGTALKIVDKRGNAVNDLAVTLIGEDAEYIYDTAGRKQFDIKDGVLALGVHPLHVPTANDPVTFSVQLDGDGYISETVRITITVSEHTSVYPVLIRGAGG